jgi:hypothetical protein
MYVWWRHRAVDCDQFWFTPISRRRNQSYTKSCVNRFRCFFLKTVKVGGLAWESYRPCHIGNEMALPFDSRRKTVTIISSDMIEIDGNQVTLLVCFFQVQANVEMRCYPLHQLQHKGSALGYYESPPIKLSTTEACCRGRK